MTLPWLSPSAERTRELIGIWRESLIEAGHDPTSREVLVMYFTHVRETERRRAPAKPPKRWLRTMGGSPGERGGENIRGMTYERLIGETRAIIGDVARCREQVAYLRDTFGATRIATVHHFGGVPQDQVLASMRLFAAEVAPSFRLC